MRSRSVCLHALALMVLWMLVLSEVSCLRAESPSSGNKPDVYALIVGVGKHRDPTITSLPAPHGAREMSTYLAELKGICFKNVYRIELTDENATKEAILEGIRELSKAGEHDVVFVFMEGHGGPLPATPDRYYFTAYDTNDDTAKTGIWVNDKHLWSRIKSERFVFLTGSCFSGGFLLGLKRSVQRGLITDFLGDLNGRFGISAAQDNEVAWMSQKYGMSLFTFWVIKALRGHAAQKDTGRITVQDFWNYVHDHVSKDSAEAQNPKIFLQTSDPAKTTIAQVPVEKEPLKIDVKFFYETDDNLLEVLTDESVLKSGQHVGIAFKPKSDCYVQIFWWDSNKNLERIFPNPQYGEGTGKVQAGKIVWLPYKGEKHWYVLDKNPGTETIYFVATRQPDKGFEQIYERLKALKNQPGKGKTGKDINKQIEEATTEQEFETRTQVMGVEPFIVPVKSKTTTYAGKEELFADMENLMKVAGREAVFKRKFKHVAR